MLEDEIIQRHEHEKLEGTYTLRQWLTMQAVVAGAPLWTAIEAVASTAMEYPELDMDEQRTWEGWAKGPGV